MKEIRIRGEHHAVSLLASFAVDKHADTRVWCQDGSILPVHSLLLASCSPFLRRLLEDAWHQDEYCLILPDFSSQIIRHFLESLTAREGWERMTLSREVKLLYSLLCCGISQPIKLEENDVNDIEIDIDNIKHEVVDAESALNVITMEAAAIEAEQITRTKMILKSPTTSKIKKKEGSKRGPYVKRKKENEDLKRVRVKRKRKRKTNYSCVVCQKGFLDEEELSRHMSATHLFQIDQEEQLRCLFFGCDFVRSSADISSWQQQLQQHELTHCCPICRTGYTTKDRISECLSGHCIAEDLERGVFICTFPSCSFVGITRKRGLEHETKKHRPELKPSKRPRKKRPSDMKVPCDDCGVLVVKKYMSDHQNIHTGEKPHVCKICGFAATSYARLKTHEYGLHRELYRCQECGSGFKSRSALLSHQLIHAGEKPHQCDICGRGFRLLGALQRHHYQHTGGEPFKCPDCNMSFPEKRRLVRHIRFQHSEERPFQCSICSSHYVDEEALRKHEKRHSEERPFKCAHCPQTFKSGQIQRQHERTHTGEKPFRCDFCFRSFSQGGTLRTHLKIHPEAKTECPRCYKKFIQPSSFRNHLKTSVMCAQFVSPEDLAKKEG